MQRTACCLVGALGIIWLVGMGSAAGSVWETCEASFAKPVLGMQPGYFIDDEMDNTTDQTNEGWRERLDKTEQRRTITALVFLGVVLLILLFWWSWGKLHHRARKL